MWFEQLSISTNHCFFEILAVKKLAFLCILYTILLTKCCIICQNLECVSSIVNCHGNPGIKFLIMCACVCLWHLVIILLKLASSFYTLCSCNIKRKLHNLELCKFSLSLYMRKTVVCVFLCVCVCVCVCVCRLIQLLNDK